MIPYLKLIIFLIITAGCVYASWGSFRNIRSHGFPRFFGWEAILALILLNIDFWFHDPFSLRQIASWVILFVSAYGAIHGLILFKLLGKADSERVDPALLNFEKTTALITTGPYRFIRHPMYGSLLFLAWGAFLKQFSYLGLALVLVATVSMIMTAKREEAENIAYFGDAYIAYMKTSKMFAPFLF